jgi:hypothetical protein
MSTNYQLVRKICDCGKEETWHIGQSASGNEFLFHAETTWNPSMRYTLWTDKIISWLETGASIVDEYGLKLSYLQLLEMIKNESKHNRRIEAEHDHADRAWMTGEFF